MNGTGTVIPLPLPYLYRTFVDVFLTHTVYNRSNILLKCTHQFCALGIAFNASNSIYGYL